jgi:hypothetical protein
MRIAAPAWSLAPDMLHARDVVLTISYADLWRAHRGHPLRIHALQAAELDASFERLQDGRASWLFGRLVRPDAARCSSCRCSTACRPMPARCAYRDEPARLELAARLQPQGEGVQLAVQGQRDGRPLALTLRADTPLPWIDRAPDAAPVPLRLHADLGDARLDFDGRAADLLHLSGLSGHFEAAGDSIAPLGRLLGLPQPGRAAFVAAGGITRATAAGGSPSSGSTSAAATCRPRSRWTASARSSTWPGGWPARG